MFGFEKDNAHMSQDQNFTTKKMALEGRVADGFEGNLGTNQENTNNCTKIF